MWLQSPFGAAEEYHSFDCSGASKKWRRLANGFIEIEDEGIVTRGWPKLVDKWADIIAAKAAKYDVPASWIATIMSIESGGQQRICYRPGGPTAPCSPKDGSGLMAMLQSTATGLAGKTVTIQMLMDDPDLSIDLGTKYMAQKKAKNNDFVTVAISYNADRVKCASASSGRTVGSPKEVCPPTPWGVIMGCTRNTKKTNPYCAPSTIVEGKWACPNLYPQAAIGAYNGAIKNGWTDFGLGLDRPVPAVPPNGELSAVAQRSFLGTLIPFAAGSILGYFAAEFFVDRLEMIK